MSASVKVWLLFHAPWRAVFRWLAWPHTALGAAQMRFICAGGQRSSSPQRGGSDA